MQKIFTGRHFSGRRKATVAKNRTIRTLDRRKLKSTDFLDLTGRACFGLKQEKEGSIRGIYSIHHDRYIKDAFPVGTRGFLYYHPRPPLPPGYDEIRFRLTKSFDPASFDHGTDLLNRFGRPWSMRQTNAHCRRLLIEDGLISPSEPVPLWNMISTLRVDQLKATDFLDFSGQKQITVRTQYGRTLVLYERSPKDAVPCPENSAGFLYYYQPPNLPPA